MKDETVVAERTDAGMSRLRVRAQTEPRRTCERGHDVTEPSSTVVMPEGSVKCRTCRDEDGARRRTKIERLQRLRLIEMRRRAQVRANSVTSPSEGVPR